MKIGDLIPTPPETDLIWKGVDFLLPATQTTAAKVGFGIFSSVLILYGIGMIALQIVQLYVHGGRLGSTSGQYNPIWAPITIVLGFGFLVPILGGNGLSTAHYFLRNIVAAASVNTYNAVARVAMKYMVQEGRPMSPVSAAGREFAWQIVSSEVCSYTFKQAVARDAVWGKYPTAAPDVPASVGVIGDGNVYWHYGPACGSSAFEYPSREKFGDFGAARNVAAKKLIDDIRAIGFQTRLAKAFECCGMSVDWKASEASTEAYAKDGLIVADLTARINEIGDRFNREVEDAAAAQAASENREQRAKMVEAVDVYGGAIVATYYRALGQLNEKSGAYASESPTRTDPNPEIWTVYRSEVQYALDIIKHQRKLESAAYVLTSKDLASAGDENASLYADILNSVMRPTTEYFLSYDGFRADPVADLMNVGNRLMLGAKVGFGVGLAATGASNFWSSTAGKIVEYVMTPGWWLLGAAYAGGAMLAIVLPNLPLIYMAFGILGFMLFLVVASIAILVWCGAHMRLDGGDNFVSPVTGPGYRYLFGGAIALPVGMLAFILAQLVNVFWLNLFMFLWSIGFLGSQGGQAIGFATLFIGVGLLIYVQWKGVMMTLSLITNLNDRVLAYLGWPSQTFGEGESGTAVVAVAGGGISNGGAAGKPQGGPKKGGDDDSPAGGKGGKGNGVSALSEAAQKAADKH